MTLTDFSNEQPPVLWGELLPACPHCESNNVEPVHTDYTCRSCDTHIDAFTWERKTEELML